MLSEKNIQYFKRKSKKNNIHNLERLHCLEWLVPGSFVLRIYRKLIDWLIAMWHTDPECVCTLVYLIFRHHLSSVRVNWVTQSQLNIEMHSAFYLWCCTHFWDVQTWLTRSASAIEHLPNDTSFLSHNTHAHTPNLWPIDLGMTIHMCALQSPSVFCLTTKLVLSIYRPNPSEIFGPK